MIIIFVNFDLIWYLKEKLKDINDIKNELMKVNAEFTVIPVNSSPLITAVCEAEQSASSRNQIYDLLQKYINDEIDPKEVNAGRI